MTRNYRIGVIPGDGIGPEVITEGLKVLAAVSEVHGFRCETVTYPFGAEHYLETSELLPLTAIEEIRGMDAVYFGAIGDPRVAPGVLEHGVLLDLSRALDLYVNVRPVRLYAGRVCPLKDRKPEDIDFVIVRETTEDAYTPYARIVHRNSPAEVAVGEMVFTRQGTERAMRFAFELASRPSRRGGLVSVHQANAIGAHDLIRRTFRSLAPDYPRVTAEEMAPDAVAMRMITTPETFDVLVTTNFIGGILSDLGAALIGGVGAAASARLHPGQVSLFEPTHGSAPKYAGAHKASPVAAILALAMLLDWIGEPEAATRIERCVSVLLESGRIPSVDARNGLTTSEVGSLVAEGVTADTL